MQSTVSGVAANQGGEKEVGRRGDNPTGRRQSDGFATKSSGRSKCKIKSYSWHLSNLVHSQYQGDNIPAGYVGVSLIEALNGPPQVTIRDPPKLDEATEAHAAQVLLRYIYS